MGYVFIAIIVGSVLATIVKKTMDSGKSNPFEMIIYDCPKLHLAEAIRISAERLRFKMEKMNARRGRIKLGVGMSRRSFGEWIFIQLTEVSSQKTKLTISCRSKDGQECFDKNYKNVETFLDALSETLSSEKFTASE